MFPINQIIREDYPSDSDDEDCENICSIKYNEAYILLLLLKSNFVIVNLISRGVFYTDNQRYLMNRIRYNITSQQDNLFHTFLKRYYNTWASETVYLCINDKYDEFNQITRDDLYIKNFKPLIFNTTKDDSFINNTDYKKFCKIIDESKYYCDYCGIWIDDKLYKRK
jgi:hypothetical protein